MSWPIKTLPATALPKKPNWRYWGVIYLILLLVVGTVQLLIAEYQAVVFWLTLLTISSLAFATLLGIRFYFYGIACDRKQIWDQERQLLKEKWQQWATEPLYLLGSVTMTANDLSSSQLLAPEQRSELEGCLGIPLKFQDNDPLLLIRTLLRELERSIILNIDSRPLEIMLLIDESDESSQLIGVLITDEFKQRFPQVEFSFHYQSVGASPTTIFEQFVEDTHQSLKLIIIYCVSTEMQTSDFVAALLLANYQTEDDCAVTLLRPMLTDSIDQGLKMLFEMQSPVKNSHALWIAHMHSERVTAITQLLDELGVIIKPDHLYLMDNWLGVTHAGYYWLLLAIVTEATLFTGKTQLLSCEIAGQALINVIDYKNKKEK